MPPLVEAALRQLDLLSAFVWVPEANASNLASASSAATGASSEGSAGTTTVTLGSLSATSGAGSAATPSLATALGAAKALSIPASRVAKSVAVLADAQPWVVVTRGDARLDMRKVGEA